MTWRISGGPVRGAVRAAGCSAQAAHHRWPAATLPGADVSATHSSATRTTGFTLIEMLTVLVVLGLTLSLVVGRGPLRSPTLDVRAAAGQVAQGLRATRAQAIARNRDVAFALDLGTGGYRIGDGPIRALPAGLRLSMVAVREATAGERLAAIGFLPDGSSTGGRVGLAAGGAALWVGVDWLTGRVSITDAR